MNKLKQGKQAALRSAIILSSLSYAMAEDLPEWVKNLNFELKGQAYAENTDFGAGQNRQGARTDLHFQRLRLTVTGKFDDVWGFKWQTCGATGTTKQGALGYALTGQDVDPNDRDVRIIDAYATAAYSEAFNLKIGLTKLPLTRANLDDCFAPLSQDRSMFVYTAYGSSPAKFSRDTGVVAWGGFLEDRLRYFAGVFQGREGMTATTHPFSGATVKSSIQPKNSLEYIARVHYALLDPEPGSGYAGSYLGQARILTIGAGIAQQASAVYKNVGATGVLANEDTADYKAVAADIMFEYPGRLGTVTFTGQYLKNDFQDAWKTNLNPGDRLVNIAGLNGQKQGNVVKAAWIIPGKFGKEGLIQPYVVSENWRFANLLGIDNQKVKQTGGGINYYLHGQNVRWTIEYLKTSFDKTTGFVGARVDPTTFAPIDKIDSYKTYRMMLQIII
jgi:hypothetical protein